MGCGCDDYCDVNVLRMKINQQLAKSTSGMQMLRCATLLNDE